MSGVASPLPFDCLTIRRRQNVSAGAAVCLTHSCPRCEFAGALRAERPVRWLLAPRQRPFRKGGLHDGPPALLASVAATFSVSAPRLADASRQEYSLGAREDTGRCLEIHCGSHDAPEGRVTSGASRKALRDTPAGARSRRRFRSETEGLTAKKKERKRDEDELPPYLLDAVALPKQLSSLLRTLRRIPPDHTLPSRFLFPRVLPLLEQFKILYRQTQLPLDEGRVSRDVRTPLGGADASCLLSLSSASAATLPACASPDAVSLEAKNAERLHTRERAAGASAIQDGALAEVDSEETRHACPAREKTQRSAVDIRAKAEAGEWSPEAGGARLRRRERGDWGKDPKERRAGSGGENHVRGQLENLRLLWRLLVLQFILKRERLNGGDLHFLASAMAKYKHYDPLLFALLLFRALELKDVMALHDLAGLVGCLARTGLLSSSPQETPTPDKCDSGFPSPSSLLGPASLSSAHAAVRPPPLSPLAVCPLDLNFAEFLALLLQPAGCGDRLPPADLSACARDPPRGNTVFSVAARLPADAAGAEEPPAALRAVASVLRAPSERGGDPSGAARPSSDGEGGRGAAGAGAGRLDSGADSAQKTREASQGDLNERERKRDQAKRHLFLSSPPSLPPLPSTCSALGEGDAGSLRLPRSSSPEAGQHVQSRSLPDLSEGLSESRASPGRDSPVAAKSSPLEETDFRRLAGVLGRALGQDAAAKREVHRLVYARLQALAAELLKATAERLPAELLEGTATGQDIGFLCEGLAAARLHNDDLAEMILMAAFPELQSEGALADSDFARFLVALREAARPQEAESCGEQSPSETRGGTKERPGRQGGSARGAAAPSCPKDEGDAKAASEDGGGRPRECVGAEVSREERESGRQGEMCGTGAEADVESARGAKPSGERDAGLWLAPPSAGPEGDLLARGRRRRSTRSPAAAAPALGRSATARGARPVASSAPSSIDASSSSLLPPVELAPMNLTSVISWIGAMGGARLAGALGACAPRGAAEEDEKRFLEISTFREVSSDAPADSSASAASRVAPPEAFSGSASLAVAAENIYRRVDVWQALSRALLRRVARVPPFALVKICGAFEASLVRDPRMMSVLAPRLLPHLDGLPLSSLASLLSSLSILGIPHPSLLSGLCRAISRRVFLDAPPPRRVYGHQGLGSAASAGSDKGGASSGERESLHAERQQRRREIEPFRTVLWRLLGAMPEAREVYIQSIRSACSSAEAREATAPSGASPLQACRGRMPPAGGGHKAPKERRKGRIHMREKGRKAAAEVLSTFYVLLGRAAGVIDVCTPQEALLVLKAQCRQNLFHTALMKGIGDALVSFAAAQGEGTSYLNTAKPDLPPHLCFLPPPHMLPATAVSSLYAAEKRSCVSSFPSEYPLTHGHLSASAPDSLSLSSTPSLSSPHAPAGPLSDSLPAASPLSSSPSSTSDYSLLSPSWRAPLSAASFFPAVLASPEARTFSSLLSHAGTSPGLPPLAQDDLLTLVCLYLSVAPSQHFSAFPSSHFASLLPDEASLLAQALGDPEAEEEALNLELPTEASQGTRAQDCEEVANWEAVVRSQSCVAEVRPRTWTATANFFDFSLVFHNSPCLCGAAGFAVSLPVSVRTGRVGLLHAFSGETPAIARRYVAPGQPSASDAALGRGRAHAHGDENEKAASSEGDAAEKTRSEPPNRIGFSPIATFCDRLSAPAAAQHSSSPQFVSARVPDLLACCARPLLLLPLPDLRLLLEAFARLLSRCGKSPGDASVREVLSDAARNEGLRLFAAFSGGAANRLARGSEEAAGGGWRSPCGGECVPGGDGRTRVAEGASAADTQLQPDGEDALRVSRLPLDVTEVAGRGALRSVRDGHALSAFFQSAQIRLAFAAAALLSRDLLGRPRDRSRGEDSAEKSRKGERPVRAEGLDGSADDARASEQRRELLLSLQALGDCGQRVEEGLLTAALEAALRAWRREEAAAEAAQREVEVNEKERRHALPPRALPSPASPDLGPPLSAPSGNESRGETHLRSARTAPSASSPSPSLPGQAAHASWPSSSAARPIHSCVEEESDAPLLSSSSPYAAEDLQASPRRFVGCFEGINSALSAREILPEAPEDASPRAAPSPGGVPPSFFLSPSSSLSVERFAVFAEEARLALSVLRLQRDAPFASPVEGSLHALFASLSSAAAHAAASAPLPFPAIPLEASAPSLERMQTAVFESFRRRLSCEAAQLRRERRRGYGVESAVAEAPVCTSHAPSLFSLEASASRSPSDSLSAAGGEADELRLLQSCRGLPWLVEEVVFSLVPQFQRAENSVGTGLSCSSFGSSPAVSPLGSSPSLLREGVASASSGSSGSCASSASIVHDAEASRRPRSSPSSCAEAAASSGVLISGARLLRVCLSASLPLSSSSGVSSPVFSLSSQHLGASSACLSSLFSAQCAARLAAVPPALLHSLLLTATFLTPLPQFLSLFPQHVLAAMLRVADQVSVQLSAREGGGFRLEDAESSACEDAENAGEETHAGRKERIDDGGAACRKAATDKNRKDNAIPQRTREFEAPHTEPVEGTQPSAPTRGCTLGYRSMRFASRSEAAPLRGTHSSMRGLTRQREEEVAREEEAAVYRKQIATEVEACLADLVCLEDRGRLEQGKKKKKTKKEATAAHALESPKRLRHQLLASSLLESGEKEDACESAVAQRTWRDAFSWLHPSLVYRVAAEPWASARTPSPAEPTSASASLSSSSSPSAPAPVSVCPGVVSSALPPFSASSLQHLRAVFERQDATRARTLQSLGEAAVQARLQPPPDFLSAARRGGFRFFNLALASDRVRQGEEPQGGEASSRDASVELNHGDRRRSADARGRRAQTEGEKDAEEGRELGAEPEGARPRLEGLFAAMRDRNGRGRVRVKATWEETERAEDRRGRQERDERGAEAEGSRSYSPGEKSKTQTEETRKTGSSGSRRETEEAGRIEPSLAEASSAIPEGVENESESGNFRERRNGGGEEAHEGEKGSDAGPAGEKLTHGGSRARGKKHREIPAYWLPSAKPSEADWERLFDSFRR
ncbi:hypothetical protein BESB_039340 [Besnoitia besnoiti]|uniref:Uncharacterized protein n=1 Tax=Besnoitia besnoiti TaxID=94643 RepID=A0A2A9MMV2_BESBE|nr:hypothetical protein BESB_039340 [Besnoitia besnoiti]PFH37476.1 hypothetical protein BESB_039340 [Besnoitia besnoiti]